MPRRPPVLSLCARRGRQTRGFSTAEACLRRSTMTAEATLCRASRAGTGDDQVPCSPAFHAPAARALLHQPIVATADAPRDAGAIDAGYTERGYDFEDLDGDGGDPGNDRPRRGPFRARFRPTPAFRTAAAPGRNGHPPVDGTVKDVTFDPAYRRVTQHAPATHAPDEGSPARGTGSGTAGSAAGSR